MNNRILLSILLIIVTAIYYLPIMNIPLAPYDEAAMLVGAEKILNGQIPHRDFSSEYPLGQYYTLAALFKIFGTSFVTERIYDIIIKTLLSFSIFSIIMLLSSWRIGLLGWLMSIIWLQHSSLPAYPVYPSMLFIFISLYMLILNAKREKTYYVVLGSISIVLAILFRHDIGGYALIAIILTHIIRSMNGERSWSVPKIFMTTAVIAGSFVLLFFLIYSSVGAFFNDLLFIPIAFLDKQSLPYPLLSRWTLPFYMFPLVIVTGAITSIIQIKRKNNDIESYAILLISLVGILCFNQARMRSDMPHLIPVALTGILLAPILLDVFSRKLSLTPLKHSLIIILFIVAFGITLSKSIRIINMLLTSTNGYVIETTSPNFERARYSIINSDIKNTAIYIKSNTSKNETIYVGVKNHDQFVSNDVIIYFFSERNSATRYHALNPGVQTTMKIQKEMINEFRNDPPKLIVLSTRIRHEQNLSGVDSKVDILDNYISTHFSLKKTFGIYEIWM